MMPYSLVERYQYCGDIQTASTESGGRRVVQTLDAFLLAWLYGASHVPEDIPGCEILRSY
jgi:hypothetical protein